MHRWYFLHFCGPRILDNFKKRDIAFSNISFCGFMEKLIEHFFIHWALSHFIWSSLLSFFHCHLTFQCLFHSWKFHPWACFLMKAKCFGGCYLWSLLGAFGRGEIRVLLKEMLLFLSWCWQG